jgi:sugar lactone lactonase YvrE
MNIIRFSKQLDAVISENAELRQLASGFAFAEGPVWSEQLNGLYFTDFRQQKIYTWQPEHGVRLYREPSGRAVGLALDAQGRLIACESQSRRISVTLADGTVRTLASHYQGKRLNNTNDVVVSRNGAIYFSDPYSTSLGDTRELAFNGVYRYDPEADRLELLTDEFERPNGLAFSPDESRLYIDDTNRQHVRVFDVAADGSLTNGRMFAQLDAEAGRGGADGLKTDACGNVYVTGPGGIWIYAPSGEGLGRIELPELAANLCFAAPDHPRYAHTLFITASTSLYSLALNVPGSGQLAQKG